MPSQKYQYHLKSISSSSRLSRIVRMILVLAKNIDEFINKHGKQLKLLQLGITSQQYSLDLLKDDPRHRCRERNCIEILASVMSKKGHARIEWDCNKWKKEIEKLTKEYGLNKWKHSMNGKTTLTWYASKNVPRFEVFYDGSFGSQLLFAVRCKALSVNRRTWRWNERNTRLCLQCNRGVEETVEHLVLDCSKYEQERESLMDVVHEQCGENKWNARCVEEDSGMRYLVGLDEECNMTVVDAMKDFLVYAWNKRQGC
ncbi:hypothetical protein FHG87_002248 [Trinorchestia longiramus]|nr:hypothetical protein FHG87_002248 [Trinorchestia longiramus]